LNKQKSNTNEKVWLAWGLGGDGQPVPQGLARAGYMEGAAGGGWCRHFLGFLRKKTLLIVKKTYICTLPIFM
jgi:hypothetical protein